MGRARIATAFAFVAAFSPAPLQGQLVSDAQMAYAARPAYGADSSTKSRKGLIAGRIILGTAGTALGAVAGSYLGAAMGVCFSGTTADQCEFDFILVGMAGGLLGSALGATLIPSPRADRCTWGGRFSRAFVGSVLGAGVSFAAGGIGASLRKGPGVAATTAVAILAPATGAAIALSSCA